MAMLEKAMALLKRPPDHPRLAPSIAPMPADRVANVVNWAAPEFVLEGKAMGLKGKKLDAFVKRRTDEARKAATEMFAES